MRRRHFLQTASAAPFAPGLLSAAAELPDNQRALIILWMDGGMSHLDTFDAKPEAPPDIRGDVESVESSLPGVFVNARVPRLAALMKDCALVRGLTSPEGNHDRGSHYVLTGRRPTPALTYPSMGALLETKGGGKLPAYVAIPDAHPYAKQGFLPPVHAPFEFGADPGKGEVDARDLLPTSGVTRALDCLREVDELDGRPRSSSEAARDEALAQARYLSGAEAARGLFDLRREPEAIRASYGRHGFGQSCLLARRLVEGGVRAVLVRSTGWDHHQNIAKELTYGFPAKLDAMDQTIPALHEDLRRRGLLDRVTVLLATEFGRTPRLNPSGGRDHWSRASCALLFGTGVKAGVVHGLTDPRGEEPVSDPVTPANLFATVLTALGADLDRVLRSPEGRPIRVAEEGPIREILRA